MHHFPHDLSVASGTGWCKELLITALTVYAVLLFHKAHIGQGCLAVSTVEFFWVPRATHGYQERTPNDAVAVPTERSSVAGWKTLSPLNCSSGYGRSQGRSWNWSRVSRSRGRRWYWSTPRKDVLCDCGGGFSRRKLLGKGLICYPGRTACWLSVGRGVGMRWCGCWLVDRGLYASSSDNSWFWSSRSSRTFTIACRSWHWCIRLACVSKNKTKVWATL